MGSSEFANAILEATTFHDIELVFEKVFHETEYLLEAAVKEPGETRIETPDWFFTWLKVKRGNVFADCTFLQKKHPEYFSTPTEALKHVSYVLSAPQYAMEASHKEYTLLFRRNGKNLSIVIELKYKGGKYRVVSAFDMSSPQLDKKINELRKSGGRVSAAPGVPPYEYGRTDRGAVPPSDGPPQSQLFESIFNKYIDVNNAVMESVVQPNQSPTVSQDQSGKAMKFTLDTQRNTMEGAHRSDIGWIAFLWGIPGTGPLFSDGDGLARIIAKQDFEKRYLPSESSGKELCMRLVDIVTRGYVKRRYGPTSYPLVDISWQGEVAVIKWDPARKTWYLYGYRKDWGSRMG